MHEKKWFEKRKSLKLALVIINTMQDFSHIFHLLFFAGLAYRTYKKHRNDFIIRALAAMFVPKEEGSKMSIATRTASRTILVPYHFQGENYELVLPVRRKKLNWTMCIAEIKGGEAIDVTNEVKPLAGPFGDFYGAHKSDLKAHQIVRNATKLYFVRGDKQIMVIE
jgi:hypothetical protein